VNNHYYYRNFFEKNYSNLKHLNPGFPFLMRTGDASPAKFIATYGNPQFNIYNLYSQLLIALFAFTQTLARKQNEI
jgi:hypothetical protein